MPLLTCSDLQYCMMLRAPAVTSLLALVPIAQRYPIVYFL
nr:MAG TPA: hypothetical protein [Caudoviricetes sp.]